jgi:hypothetical protein
LRKHPFVKVTRPLSFVSIIILSSCVDRISYSVTSPLNLPVAVYGYISNKPGPYQVNINSSVDPESTASPRVAVSARHVNLLDDLGNNEELHEVSTGIYKTSPTGIQGRIGGVYKLRVELLNGNIFESTPDTLLSPGTIDTLYYNFNERVDFSGQTSYGFDVKVNAHANEQRGARYMWNFAGTFKAITHPELLSTARAGCYPDPERHGLCNFLPLCTGLRLTDSGYQRVGPCTCCTCWYQIFNNAPILSDEIYNSSGIYNGVPIYRIRLNEWIFMFKVHAEVIQSTLTTNSFRFFKSIRDQKVALGSLFQPITGKIPGNFIQVAGTPASINGIFYATGTSNKNSYITPDDVPHSIPVPQVDFSPQINGGGIGWLSCLELFPNATNVKPDFWID